MSEWKTLQVQRVGGTSECWKVSELQAKLGSLAAQQGSDSASPVHEAVERLIGYGEWFIRQVEEGFAHIDEREREISLCAGRRIRGSECGRKSRPPSFEMTGGGASGEEKADPSLRSG